MIDFYYWPTPNGWKISIMLEECGLEYRTIPVNIGKGDQFKPEFLAISPNNRMPAIVDHDDPESGWRSDQRLRVGRDPAASRREERPVHAGGQEGAQGGHGMAVLAGRQSRADGRAA